ncbi:nudix hydrolase 8-like isoform X2 [Magnolia sinica]|uniref:nudix hydrolase 8-like isoform X2 n=1 Tax=Magnolia sinica TaxID=86752 RepID=UPI00265A67E2|nr:nudix hydrolase 8-like isoform X2 [Magnolia sinica]
MQPFRCYLYHTWNLSRRCNHALFVILMMMAAVAAINWQLPGWCCHRLSSESRISWAGNHSFCGAAGALEFKQLCLSKTSFPISKNALSFRGNATNGMRANVASPKKSLNRRLDILDAYEDEYNGMIIDPECLPSSANAFVSVLRASIADWKQKGKKGIWLKILVEQADLVPIAIKEGFSYHHAEPGYVMLTYWIPKEPCMLPANASHQVGVGGFVINEKREVLVVKEKQCPCRCSGTWKLPTGFINKSEEIFTGAIRETKEETGIDTAFLEVIAFRHAHLVSFEKSDLLFICMLKPLSFDITIDESEIEAAKILAKLSHAN